MRSTYLIFCLVLVFGQDVDLLSNIDFGAMESWRNDCSKKAIQEIIPQCTEGIETLTPIQQKKIAVELSICAFENVKIQYPGECKLGDIDECIQLLEKSSQLWTTFIGYYREVKNLCHQISLPFEKDQILSVYENITDLYKQLIDDLNESNEQSARTQDVLKAKFDKLINIVDEIIADREKDKTDMNESFSMFQGNFERSLSNAVVILQNSYDGANTNIREMESHLNYFAQQLSLVHLLMRDRMRELELQQNEIHQNNAEIIQQTENTLNKLELINESINEIDESNRHLAKGVKNQLEFSEFSISLLNSHIQRSIDDIALQRQYIGVQGPMILEQIAAAFVGQLNHSAKDIVGSLANEVNSTLTTLKVKMKETENSLEEINFKALRFVNMIESMSGYVSRLVRIPSSVKSAASRVLQRANSFSQLITLVLVSAVIIMALPFLSLLKKLPVGLCFQLISEFGVFIGPISFGILCSAAMFLTLRSSTDGGLTEVLGSS
ncbi:Nuclear fusion protein KAR5 [Candida viswanathii]|uniref:Nuclear fusion protein KAR5 n=1 Tax=Candida viswanathii TaxID=5486 RepID=A0A367XZ64_9ASCO|nr:Nuclear fusion protein KAR5 [Candida viswanathii]